jgi:hypothetical protein
MVMMAIMNPDGQIFIVWDILEDNLGIFSDNLCGQNVTAPH